MADIAAAGRLIGRLLADQAKYLASVEGKVTELQEELDWMLCFLEETDARQFNSAMARKWVARIREYAYESENIIEKFLLKVYPVSKGRADLLSLLRKCKKVLCQLFLVYQTGSDIDKLKDKISNLSSKLHTYRIELKNKMGESSFFERSNLKFDKYYKSEEEEMIGRNSDVRELVSQLVDPKSRSTVIAICGKSGVGKTFLAKNIFNEKKIRREFDVAVWVNVSQPCPISSVLQELLSSLTSKSSEQIAQMTDDELEDGLSKALRKHSLIVLDGINKEAWDRLKKAIPIAKGGFNSKLLLTTQTVEVAKRVDENAIIHLLDPLTTGESELLLRKKLGHRSKVLDDKSMEEVEEMLNHCSGIPLNIVVLAGILATTRTRNDNTDIFWFVLDKIKACSIDNTDQNWRSIIELSYYQFPYQLKQCFLYLGSFPTNLQISTRKITQLWEAEGLVSSKEDDETEDTPQDIAESCLAELVERSLVQVGSRGLTGKAKTIQIHELARQFCISELKKGNWLNVHELEPSSSTSSKSLKSSKSARRRYRRLAIYCNQKFVQLPSDYRQASYVRSLLFFNTLDAEDVLMSLTRQALRKAFLDFQLLRVLDMENMHVEKLPDEVGFLIHLRYLSLKGSWVSELPSTIKTLRSLETLDLRVLSFVRLRIPDVLHKLGRLIHLYLPATFALRHKASELELKGLVKLETLKNLSTKCKAEDLHYLTDLRRLTSSDFLSERHLWQISFRLDHMEHLALRLDGEILRKDRRILSSCKSLRKLWVRGEITGSLSSVMLPDTLVQLSLYLSRFQEGDPMQVLGKLPNLTRLSLEQASYEGSEMHCSKDGFKNLRYLTLHALEALRRWGVEEGAMPKLLTLEINRCWQLETIPEGLGHVKSLQELTISYMPLSFFSGWNPAEDLKEWCDYRKVRHVPSINIFNVMSLVPHQLCDLDKPYA